MDEYHYLRRSHVPAFGSWEYCANAAALDDLPFTQCFESARQPAAAAAGFFPIYTAYDQDQDLYVAGDLYRNDVVTPTMIVVSRAGGKKGRQGKEQGRTMIKKKKKIDDDDDGWMHCDAVKVAQSPEPTPRKPPKAVDEDLYKISPELLHTKPKKKRRAGLFSSCLLPTCVS